MTCGWRIKIFDWLVEIGYDGVRNKGHGKDIHDKKKKNKRHEVGKKLDVCVQETPRTAVGLRAASVNGKSDC